MKLRVLNNSVRLRLTRKEVDEAVTRGIVRGSVSFPGGATFRYVLEGTPGSTNSTATFSDGDLTIRMPQRDVQSWASSDEVSLVAQQPLDDGQSLDILVEKDFACLAPRENEDESDMFPHPQAGKESC
jgi:hypothetical protein